MTTRPSIEGDGCRVNFYNNMMRTPGSPFALSVAIPDTIVFEHNCPRSWYYYDFEAKEVRRRAGRDLQASTILHDFCQKPIFVGSHEIDICATFTHIRHRTADVSSSSEPVVTVLHLSRDELEHLLNTPSTAKLEGILQKYFLPMEANECVIQATWGSKVCLVRRRMNLHELSDKPRILAEKHVTFDGPDRYSIEVSCAKETVNDVTLSMEAMVEHLARALRLRPVNLIVFFKLDRMGRLRLLWCSSLRLVGHTCHDCPTPTFLCPVLDSTEDESAKLALADGAQQRLVASSISGTSERSKGRRRNPHDAAQPRTGERSPIATPDSRIAEKLLCATWYRVSDEIEEEYNDVMRDSEAARSIIDDTLYGAVAFYQQHHDPYEYKFRFPMELNNALREECCVKDLCRFIGVSTTIAGDHVIPVINVKDGVSAPPPAAMISLAHEWLSRHFADRLSKLVSRALPLLQLAAVKRKMVEANA